MAKTTNEILFDKLVRHQIGLTRLASGTAKQLNDFLDKNVEKVESVLAGLGNRRPAVEKILRELKKTNVAIYESLGKQLQKELLSVGKYEAGYQKKTLLDAMPKEAANQLNPKVPPAKVIRDVVNKRPIDGALLSERVAGMEAGHYNRMRDVIRRELSKGGDPFDVAKAIDAGIFGTRTANYKDGVWATANRSIEQQTKQTQLGVVTGVNNEFYQNNDDIFEGEQWVSVLDTQTTEICMELDGTVFPLDEGPRPPAHYGCRSQMVPVVKDWEAMGLSDLGPGSRESLTGEVPETQTYPEWLKEQPDWVQNEALGPSRADMFRDGTPISAFTDDYGRKLTLDELAKQDGKG